MEAYMKSGSKHIIHIIFFLLLFSYARAQVSFRSNISRDNILIGETISLTVEAYVPIGANISWFSSDTLPHFEILKKSGIDTIQNIDAKKLAQNFEITSFDSGKQYIPPFEVIVDNQPYYTDSILINVTFTPFDPNEDYKDIKDIIDVKNPSIKYLPWAIAGIAALSVALLIYLWYKRKFAARPLKEEQIPALTPYEEAMKALSRLALKNLSNGEVKTFYSEMNDILRKYVSRKFSVSTFERTNEELILGLSEMNIPKDALISLAQSLRMSDFVKFAKYRPGDDENRNNLKIVTSSIEILDKNSISAV